MHCARCFTVCAKPARCVGVGGWGEPLGAKYMHPFFDFDFDCTKQSPQGVWGQSVTRTIENQGEKCRVFLISGSVYPPPPHLTFDLRPRTGRLLAAPPALIRFHPSLSNMSRAAIQHVGPLVRPQPIKSSTCGQNQVPRSSRVLIGSDLERTDASNARFPSKAQNNLLARTPNWLRGKKLE